MNGNKLSRTRICICINVYVYVYVYFFYMQCQQIVTNSANAVALDGDLYVCIYVHKYICTYTYEHAMFVEERLG